MYKVTNYMSRCTNYKGVIVDQNNLMARQITVIKLRIFASFVEAVGIQLMFCITFNRGRRP